MSRGVSRTEIERGCLQGGARGTAQSGMLTLISWLSPFKCKLNAKCCFKNTKWLPYIHARILTHPLSHTHTNTLSLLYTHTLTHNNNYANVMPQCCQDSFSHLSLSLHFHLHLLQPASPPQSLPSPPPLLAGTATLSTCLHLADFM